MKASQAEPDGFETGIAGAGPGQWDKVEDWLAIAVKDDQWNRMERVASMCGRCLTTRPAGLAHP